MHFENISLSFVPRDPNVRLDLLSQLASSKLLKYHKHVIQET